MAWRSLQFVVEDFNQKELKSIDEKYKRIVKTKSKVKQVGCYNETMKYKICDAYKTIFHIPDDG